MVFGLNMLQRLRLRLYKYEERRGGFSCMSCRFFIHSTEDPGFCSNPFIKSPVRPMGCCTLWRGPSQFRA